MITYKYRDIIKVSTPLMFGMLIQVLVGVTDTAFLGRVGEIELGASAIAGIMYLLIFMISQSFAVGAQIIMSRRNGEKNYVKIAHVFYQTLNAIILFSIISIAAINLLAPAILDAVIKDKLVSNAILIYIVTRSIGLLFSGLKSSFRSFFISIICTKQLLPAALILLISNFIFDYWFIFGGFGIEPMGLKGAALASVLAEAMACIYLTLYVIFKIDLLKYGFHKFLLWKHSLFNNIFRLSIWIIVQNVLCWAIWLYFFVEIEKLGTNELAVSNILRSLSALPFIVANALAMVTSSFVSNLIGAGKDREVAETAWRIIKLGSIPYYISIILIGLFPEICLSLYTDNIDIIKMAKAPLWAVLSTYITAFPAMIYFYCIYGTGKTKIALIVEVMASIVYITSIWLIVRVLKADLVWCWISELPYYIVLGIASYWYIKQNKWCCEII